MAKVSLGIIVFLFSAMVNSTTLLIVGDSLSAGYRMSSEESWPVLLDKQLQPLGKSAKIINASISGDTTGNGLARLPSLLAQHTPDSVLIELGANDGLRGFPVARVKENLQKMIQLIKAQNAQPLLMQIHIPPNYGKRYTTAFSSLYISLSEKNQIPLLPFFLEQVIQKPQWMMEDGLHPTPQAQPWIAEFMAKELAPYL
ncbi:multifunctional acyl-CoA thioesterase I/protease I/lysophospholipase L1 [Psychromonas sp. MME2]|uniref:multifunctional acyl-CoA thioesterase I/protease I/lysophospholipase L1 n=1 Tax=unclassified Psychromonas TaxID=2614957 RepID=UPI00339CE58A